MLFQNTLEDLHNLMLATGTDEFKSVADQSYIGRAALNANTNWNSVLGGSNDDAGVSQQRPLSGNDPIQTNVSRHSGSSLLYGKLLTTKAVAV